MDTIKIGNFLKELRNEKGYTQQEVADLLFVSQKTISRWESGNGIPDINIIVDVAQFYGVTVDELLKGERITRSTEEINEENIKASYGKINSGKILSKNILSKQNICFIISSSIILFFLILGLIILLLINKLAGKIIMPVGYIIGLLVYIYGIYELKKCYKDNEMQNYLDDFNYNFKKKNLLFADFFFVITFFYFVIINILQFYLILLIIIFSYLIIRKEFKKDKFDEKTLNKKISLISLICSAICVLTIFISAYNSKSSSIVSGSLMQYATTTNNYFNIFNLFSNYISKFYILRIISIIIFVLYAILLIKSYKKEKYLMQIICLIVGIIGNFVIFLDLIIFKRSTINNLIILPSFIGVFALLISVFANIYLIKCEKKNNII